MCWVGPGIVRPGGTLGQLCQVLPGHGLSGNATECYSEFNSASGYKFAERGMSQKKTTIAKFRA